eukprot:scaffold99549_cov21-Tisochrysis_lutea.AAC.4
MGRRTHVVSKGQSSQEQWIVRLREATRPTRIPEAAGHRDERGNAVLSTAAHNCERAPCKPRPGCLFPNSQWHVNGTRMAKWHH